MARLAIALPIILAAALMAGRSAASDGLLGTMLRQAGTLPVEQAGEDLPQARLYDDTTLTRASLRTCLIAAHDLDRGERRIEAERQRLGRLRGELEAAQARLQAATRASNGIPRSRDQALIDDLRDRRQGYLAALATFETDVEQRNGSVADFNRNCAGKRYHAADLAAVRSDLPFDLAPFERPPR
jgi:hypothetical protein